MSVTSQVSPSEPPRALPSRWWAHEDWVAVWLGAAALLLVALGASPPLPSLRWNGSATLALLFAPGVLLPWATAGLAAWVLSAAGVALQGGNVRRYSLGYGVVFALAWAALVLAGNATSTA